jgi:hypothetical protein
LTANNTIWWYFIIPLLMAGMVSSLEPILRWTFEARRWSPVTGSGDDDGDDDD